MNPFGKVAPFFAISAEYASLALVASSFATCSGVFSAGFGASAGVGGGAAFACALAGASLIHVPNFLASG